MKNKDLKKIVLLKYQYGDTLIEIHGDLNGAKSYVSLGVSHYQAHQSQERRTTFER